MTLLYFLNHITNSGGMERIVIDKINYLVNAGYDVSLVYFGSNDDEPFYPIDKKVCLRPLSQSIEGSSFIKKAKTFLSLISALRKLFKDINPDVIINANTIVVSWLLPFIHGNIPIVVEHHFSWIGMRMFNKQNYGNNKIKGWLNTLFRNTFYPLYTRCIVLTHEDAKLWGFKNVSVIPNFSLLNLNGNSTSIKENLVIAVGRLSEQKDFALLLEVWKIVVKRKKSYKLEIWGDGPLKDSLQSIINEYDINDCVRLMGTTKDIASKYKRASLFVLSSKFEGMPLCVIEAMQTGIPCLSYNILGVSDLIENGKNGYIIEERTANAMADKICYMLELNPLEWDKMSRAALSKAKEYDKDVIMQKWMSLFKELTNK